MVKNSDTLSSDSPKNEDKSSGLFVIILNGILLICVFLLFARYTSLYQSKLTEENLGNITNLNRSAATNATSIISDWNTKLNDIAKYAQIHNLTIEEALELIDETNSDENRYFELIGEDYTGYTALAQADGSYPLLDYSSTSYSSLHKVFDDKDDSDFGDIRFCPEFTDNGVTALKFFAIYKHITLINQEGRPEIFTLLLATRSRDVLSILNSQRDFEGQSSVMIDKEGYYIVGSNDFKSDNFFQYLYTYNDLTLDEKNALRDEMKQNKSGELYYKSSSSLSQDCVFRYEMMSTNGWYCITCVPLSSFHTPDYRISYVIYGFLLLLAIFAVDVSWLQRMNQRLRTSMLREKEASQAKGSFMSRMSHEIRTPLNAIIGYNIIARNELNDNTKGNLVHLEAKIMDCLTKSDVASKHLLNIINDVLDMSAIESGKIQVTEERFDFKGLIASLTTIFYSQAASKRVDLEVAFENMTEEWFIGDSMRPSQVLTNILSNAVKFTSSGGKVKLSICQIASDGATAKIRFEISDTGIGMSQEYLSHIWTPFEQADSSISRNFGGTGLGLSITKSLVDLMGGTIEVESELGVGSTFTVELSFGRTQQSLNSRAYDFTDFNALVVDDDKNTCEYIKLLFERCSARCTAVYSGDEALWAMKEAIAQGKPYNLCLVDWKMPEMDGLTTIEHLRELAGEDLPIIVLTAYDYSEIATKAANMGVNRFISKPLFHSSLFDLLATLSGDKTENIITKNDTYNFAQATILLAEDNAMNMEIARKILESTGITVEGAWNGEEAVTKFTASEDGKYTAILMDVHMPKMDGHEATRTIRASSHPQAKSIPIIAMTADAFAENVQESIAAGMNDHISKPIDIPILFDTLSKYMNTAKK